MKKLLIILSLFFSVNAHSQITSNSGFLFVGGVTTCTDADAQAYIDSSGISDATYEAALHCFFKGLKDSVALWDSMSTGAAYWLIGGTEAKVKLNIFDPVDNDANYRLTFVNSPTFSDSGVVWNGTSQYANTHFVPSGASLIYTSGHLSYYSTSDTEKASEFAMGGQNSSSQSMYLIIRRPTPPSTTGNFAYPRGNAYNVVSVNTHGDGFFSGSRNAADSNRYYVNGIETSYSYATAASTSAVTRDIYLGCVNNNGAAGFYTDKTCAFASMGVGLTPAQERALNFLVEQLMDAMGVGKQ